MLGLVWFVQVVHYPLFNFAAGDRFSDFEKSHTRLATYVVAPVMVVELVTSTILLFKSTASMKPFFIAGFVLVLGIWLSTFLVQVPRHKNLKNGYDSNVHRSLVISNWIRTACWTLRALLILYIVNIFFLFI